MIDKFAEREKTLRRHQAYLRALHTYPGGAENGFQVWQAGALRTLLVDTRYGPALIDHARDRGAALHIWGPRVAGATINRDLIMLFQVALVSWYEEPGLHRLSLQDFLITPILVGSAWIKPKEIIHEVANTEGSAHLGFKKSKELQLMKGATLSRGNGVIEEYDLYRFFFQMTEWALEAIAFVLNTSVAPTVSAE